MCYPSVLWAQKSSLRTEEGDAGPRSVSMVQGFGSFETGINSAASQIGGTYTAGIEASRIAASDWHECSAKSATHLTDLANICDRSKLGV